VGVLIFYLVSPATSYLIFGKFFPSLGLRWFSACFFLPLSVFRLLLLFTSQLALRGSQHAMGYLLLSWVSILQLVWFPTLQTQVSTEDLLATVAFTFVGAWVVWLGAEALAYLAEKQHSRLSWLALLATYLSLSLVILYGVLKGYRLHEMFIFAFQDPVSGGVYNYLALADSLGITARFYSWVS